MTGSLSNATRGVQPVPWYRRWLRMSGAAARANAANDPLMERLLAAARAGDVVPMPIIEDEALRFPFSGQSIDDGLRYSFDFIVTVSALGLRPGSVVLDFGSGFGWSTELLNRLGFHTVTYDIEARLIRIGRQRLALDPRCAPERVHHVAGSGLALPFTDASFDGILCLNALHHMPDYASVLSEMCRVLRPGGRAAFSEPGSGHTSNPATRMCMEQCGMLERDVIAADVQQLALSAGFSRMMLKPYRYPEHVMIELDVQRPTLRQRLLRVLTAVAEQHQLMRYATEGHLLFYLEKASDETGHARGQKLAATIDIVECPPRASSGDTITVIARCRNRGDVEWPVVPTRWSAPVTFGIKVLDLNGALIDDHRGRTALSADVAPGAHADIVASVSLTGLPPGSYRLLFDMVSEHVCWFQAAGSLPVERPLEVA